MHFAKFEMFNRPKIVWNVYRYGYENQFYLPILNKVFWIFIALCNKFAINRDVQLFAILWYLKLNYFDNIVFSPHIGLELPWSPH